MRKLLQGFYSVLFSLVLYLSFSPSFLFASQNQISGTVYNHQKEPLSYSIVRNLSQENYTISNKNGLFVLDKIKDSDTIKVYRYGYQDQIFEIDSTQNYFRIYLSPQSLSHDTIFVSGDSERGKNSSGYFTRLEEVQEKNNLENREILSSLPGSYLKSYGGNAGVKTLSLNGAPSEHTRVLLSGFDISNKQNGLVDFSQLPSQLVQNIVMRSANSSNRENKGTEGSIVLRPWKNESAVSFALGSAGLREYSGRLAKKRDESNLGLIAGYKYTRGDYSYYNRVTQKTEHRKNNAFDQKYIGTKFRTTFANQYNLQSIFIHSRQKRGVAGKYWSPTPDAYRKDNLTILGNKLNYLYQGGYSSISTLFRRSEEHYNRKGKNVIFPLQSEHFVYSYKGKIANYHKFAPFFISNQSILAQYHSLNSSGAGDHGRAEYVTTISPRLGKKLSLTPQIKWDYSPEHYSQFNPSLLIKWKIGERKIIDYLSFRYNKSFYYPNFNDLYWEPGGNSDLNPEYTNNYSLEASFSLSENSGVKFNLYHRISSDLIQWLPGQSFWHPVNIKEVERQGVKFSCDYHSETLPIDMYGNFFLNRSRNIKRQNRQLTYTPRKSGNILMDIGRGKWSLHTRLNYTGERIVSYGVSYDKTLAPVYNISLKASYRINIGTFTLELRPGAENVLDENLTTVIGYPSQGRSYKLEIKLIKD